MSDLKTLWFCSSCFYLVPEFDRDGVKFVPAAVAPGDCKCDCCGRVSRGRFAAYVPAVAGQGGQDA